MNIDDILAELRAELAQRYGYRIAGGDHEGRYDLHDADTGARVALNLTPDQLRAFCMATRIICAN